MPTFPAQIIRNILFNINCCISISVKKQNHLSKMFKSIIKNLIIIIAVVSVVESGYYQFTNYECQNSVIIN